MGGGHGVRIELFVGHVATREAMEQPIFGSQISYSLNSLSANRALGESTILSGDHCY